MDSYHVTQSLVIDHADVDIGFHLLSPDARVERFASVVVEASGLQLFAKVIHRTLLLAELEGGAVLFVIILDYSQSFTIIHNHSQSFTIIQNHSQSFIIIHNHSQSFTIIQIHSKSLSIIINHSRLFTIIINHSNLPCTFRGGRRTFQPWTQ